MQHPAAIGVGEQARQYRRQAGPVDPQFDGHYCVSAELALRALGGDDRR